MIMQSNMTLMMCVIITGWWKLHGNISRNGYGNAIIGRYGGYSEEDIRMLMCETMYHITGYGCTSEVCITSRGEKGQCTVSKRLANCRKVRARITHGLTLVIKNSHTYCKAYYPSKKSTMTHAPSGEIGRDNHRAPPTFTQRKTLNNKSCSNFLA